MISANLIKQIFLTNLHEVEPATTPGYSLKANNPINILFNMEARFFSRQEQEQAKAKLTKNIYELKIELNRNIYFFLGPLDKIKLAFKLLRNNFSIAEQKDPSFIGSINTNKLDCDNASLIILALSWELNWAVKLKIYPHHAIIYFKDRNIEINGEEYPNSFYQERFNLSRSLKIEPLDHNGLLGFFHTNCGLILFKRNNFTEAKYYFTKAVNLNNSDSTNWLNLGSCEYKLKNYSTAVTAFTQTIQINRNDENAYFNRALSYYELKNYTAAETDLKYILDYFSTDNSMVYNALGCIQADLNNYPKAMSLFNTAIARDKRNIFAWQNRATLKKITGDTAGAQHDLQEVVKLKNL